MSLDHLLPQSEWFRPPQFHRMGQRGDAFWFLWIAEPLKCEGVYGVSFCVSDSLAFTVCNIDRVYNKLRAGALKELYRRIEQGEKWPEASSLDTFDWNPILIRNEAGELSIQEPEAINELRASDGPSIRS